MKKVKAVYFGEVKMSFWLKKKGQLSFSENPKRFPTQTICWNPLRWASPFVSQQFYIRIGQMLNTVTTIEGEVNLEIWPYSETTVSTGGPSSRYEYTVKFH